MRCNLEQVYKLKFNFIILLYLFNTSIALAEKFDLGPFKGKLSGTLTFAIDNSLVDYEFVSINLKNGIVDITKDFKSSLGVVVLTEPEISLDQKLVLFSGFSEKNNNLELQIYKLDIKSKELSVWSKSKLNFIFPRYSSNGKFLAFTNLYDSKHTKNVIYDFSNNSFKDLPCLAPYQCGAPNWDKKNKNIVYVNNKSHNINSINIKSSKIRQLHLVKDNDTVAYPSYTFNNNIIFTKHSKKNNIVNKSGIIVIDEFKKVNNIYNRNEYILSAITLNDDRYIAFVTKEYINQSKLTIYDRKTKEKIIYSKSLRTISPPVWRP